MINGDLSCGLSGGLVQHHGQWLRGHSRHRAQPTNSGRDGHRQDQQTLQSLPKILGITAAGDTHTHIYIYIYIYFLTLIGTTHNYSYTHMYNVKPGLINPKRLFNWEGTIEVSNHDIGGIPPN